MEACIDFLQWLPRDLSLNILRCLDDSTDLIRASAVSRFWHHFVITGGLCRLLCVKMFPQFGRIVQVAELRCKTQKAADEGPSNFKELDTLKRDHRVYASLHRALTMFTYGDCIADAVSATSTDNYPRESILNTLDPRDRILHVPSYWSSKGQNCSSVPETLTYKLRSDLCLITEINIQPFEAYFQPGSPIYSSKYVRFRMGHPRSSKDLESDLLHLPLEKPADDKFVWTYTSQEFPMAQENKLQKFKLPNPVICIGGFLQIELLGRIQTQEMDGLFYICVNYVQVVGRLLFPAFDIEILDLPGNMMLKYYPDDFYRALNGSSDDGTQQHLPPLAAEEMLWGHLESLVEFLLNRNGSGAADQ